MVELLVVIAIISILVAVLTPMLGRAKEEARSVACASLLRGHGLALAIYASDNNNYYPSSPGSTSAAWARNLEIAGALQEGSWSWHKLVSGPLLCPSTKNPFPGYYMLSSYGPTLSNYAANDNGDPAQDPELQNQTGGMLLTFASGYRDLPKRQSHVMSGSVLIVEKTLAWKSDTVWSYDPPWVSSYDWNVASYTTYYYEDPSLSKFAANYRHLDAANFLLADMHVARYSRGQIFSGNWIPEK